MSRTRQANKPEIHVFAELPRISIRARRPDAVVPGTDQCLVVWLREQAMDARKRADKLECRGARWGLVALATAYDCRANHVESAIATDPLLRSG